MYKYVVGIYKKELCGKSWYLKSVNLCLYFMKPTYLGGAGGGVELNKATQKNKYKKYENKNIIILNIYMTIIL